MASTLRLCVLAASVLLVAGKNSMEDEKTKECRDQRHACTTLMKYPDGLEVDEGPYCLCPQNLPCGNWTEDDGKAITWHHHERAHWLIQYRFCRPLLPEVTCQPGKLAAKVTTELKEWHPVLDSPRCRCPDNKYHLQGWRRSNDVWTYFYYCEKPECQGHEATCAKIYINPDNAPGTRVQETQFLCGCPQHQLCPSKLRERDDEPKDEQLRDSEGVYVLKTCENIRREKKT